MHLDRILTMSGEKLLQTAGSISHDKAIEKATNEYKKYQQKTLSEVEKNYLESLKVIEQKTKKWWIEFMKEYIVKNKSFGFGMVGNQVFILHPDIHLILLIGVGKHIPSFKYWNVNRNTMRDMVQND